MADRTQSDIVAQLRAELAAAQAALREAESAVRACEDVGIGYYIETIGGDKKAWDAAIDAAKGSDPTSPDSAP